MLLLLLLLQGHVHLPHCITVAIVLHRVGDLLLWEDSSHVVHVAAVHGLHRGEGRLHGAGGTVPPAARRVHGERPPWNDLVVGGRVVVGRGGEVEGVVVLWGGNHWGMDVHGVGTPGSLEVTV